ncbi:uncharacterized protein UMAG_11420 [Mycosarcoma maydis]|uniref:Reverse transcriptase Ty1/copia-type domain-containing protein n=1 Tax=Mycosarcoma maydis TaxID=5270 RepID=A0A0D1E8M2_MYCMD|nr:uncharacterized protein UMAG_11420 [Ustilago maydis 521]KIS71781.1 hypothetical protein UMAG_11420 [Ustilago maydis 521]|eukprot:XP_011386748.1 hypothetical protein UMAG_11420 [Ustilago maydis 521]
MGFSSLPCAPCVYLRGTGDSKIIIAVYVDDMLITGPDRKGVDAVKAAITTKWKITDNGRAKELLKIRISRNRQARTLTLDQRAYIESIIKQWLPKNSKSWCPMDSTPVPAPMDFVPSAALKEQYPALVGKLLCVSTPSDPTSISLSIALPVTCRDPHNPPWRQP